MMIRKPMGAVQAGKHAQRLLAEHERRKRQGATQSDERRKRQGATQSDEEAFQRIKQSVHTPDLAQQILESFESVETLDEHRHKG